MEFCLVSLPFVGPSGSLEGLFHALDGHFRTFHGAFYIGAHLRLAEAPSCPPARMWLCVPSGFPERHSHSQLPRLSVAFTVGTFCLPSGPLRAYVTVFHALPVGLIPSMREQLLLGGRNAWPRALFLLRDCWTTQGWQLCLITRSHGRSSQLLATHLELAPGLLFGCLLSSGLSSRSVLSMRPETMSLRQDVSALCTHHSDLPRGSGIAGDTKKTKGNDSNFSSCQLFVRIAQTCDVHQSARATARYNFRSLSSRVRTVIASCLSLGSTTDDRRGTKRRWLLLTTAPPGCVEVPRNTAFVPPRRHFVGQSS